jgi:hypothetical protein
MIMDIFKKPQVCSFCKEEMDQHGATPYRTSAPNDALAPIPRQRVEMIPFFKKHKSATMLVIGTSSSIVAGLWIVPMLTIKVGIGLLGLLGAFGVLWLLFPGAHKLGHGVGIKLFGWDRRYDWDLGPSAWLVGIVVMGIMPASYGIGAALLHMLGK